MDPAKREVAPKVSTVVDVDLGNRSYPIYIGSGLLDVPDLLQRYANRFALIARGLAPLASVD